jgi:hypothetical protein
MAEHGWTRTAIDRFLGEPDELAINPHYRSGPKMRLYRVERVLSVQRSQDFQDWLRSKHDRKRKAGTAQERRFEQFNRKYVSWRVAVSAGCEYLFNLNRYAKHQSCSAAHRDEIYKLKTKVVALLFSHGYCVECSTHHRDHPAQVCFACDGVGVFDFSDDEPCHRCKGTGLYRRAKTTRTILFCFKVEEKTYCWHQPAKLVRFSYDSTESSMWKATEDDQEKPVTLTKAKFSIAKDLLRWILQEASKADELQQAA